MHKVHVSTIILHHTQNRHSLRLFLTGKYGKQESPVRVHIKNFPITLSCWSKFNYRNSADTKARRDKDCCWGLQRIHNSVRQEKCMLCVILYVMKCLYMKPNGHKISTFHSVVFPDSKVVSEYVSSQTKGL